MARSQLTSNPPESPSSYANDECEQECDGPRVLEILGDSYTQRVLSAIGDGCLTGSEIIEYSGVSKATAYRRLDDLQTVGIVDSKMHIDPGGHHCEQYYIAVDQLCISFDVNGLEVETASDTESPVENQSALLIGADD